MDNRRMGSRKLIVALVISTAIGVALTHNVFADMNKGINSQINKFYKVIQLAQMYYVEDIEWDGAIEGAISGMLEKMDPHSVYISPKKVKENDENFSGKYEGIGVRYDIIDRYLTVISPIPGSPSARLGIQAGDRISKIDGESVLGIEHDDVPRRLKGPKGSKVTVTILRDGVDKPFDLTIVRDIIPISTIGASFMVDDTTGYIWVTRFASPTAREVEEKLLELEDRNMQRLILDLRENSGGYLHEAVKVAGKFIPGHKQIVYTKGRTDQVEEEYYADQFGRRIVRNYPLILLIDRGSASASEIVAGALQDYDRAVLVGENSFGKGLVQKQFSLQDGSAVRVTTAKYYTPSGRCIQRDYKGKEIEEYYDDVPDSTWGSSDSLNKRPAFRTENGRTVYGGGGIQPDFFVGRTPASKSPELMNRLVSERLFFEFANIYAGKHPELKTDIHRFNRYFQPNDALVASFQRFCKGREVEVDAEEFARDVDFVRIRLKAEIARKFWDTNGYHYVMLGNDNQYREAITHFVEARKIYSQN